jgi:hypothetical protein
MRGVPQPVAVPTLIHAVPRLVEEGIRSGVSKTADDVLGRRQTWALYAGAAVGGFVAVKSALLIHRERKLDAIEDKLNETLDILEDVSAVAPAH